MSEPLSEATRILGERIRSERIRKSMTQDELADNAGLNRSNFGNIERGTTNATIHTVVLIASALRVDPGSLIKGLKIEDLPTSLTEFHFVRERRKREI